MDGGLGGRRPSAVPAPSPTASASHAFEPHLSGTLSSTLSGTRSLDSTARRRSVAAHDPTLNRSDPYAASIRRRRSSAAVAPQVADTDHLISGIGGVPLPHIDTSASAASTALLSPARRPSVADPLSPTGQPAQQTPTAQRRPSQALPPQRQLLPPLSPASASVRATLSPAASPSSAAAAAAPVSRPALSPVSAHNPALARTLPSPAASGEGRRRSSAASVSQVQVGRSVHPAAAAASPSNSRCFDRLWRTLSWPCPNSHLTLLLP